jgi:hypothetical protein
MSASHNKLLLLMLRENFLMKYWLIAVGWALICFTGGAFILSITREEDMNILLFVGGLIGMIFMVLGIFMKKGSKLVNPFFRQ